MIATRTAKFGNRSILYLLRVFRRRRFAEWNSFSAFCAINGKIPFLGLNEAGHNSSRGKRDKYLICKENAIEGRVPRLEDSGFDLTDDRWVIVSSVAERASPDRLTELVPWLKLRLRMVPPVKHLNLKGMEPDTPHNWGLGRHLPTWIAKRRETALYFAVGLCPYFAILLLSAEHSLRS